MEGIIQGDPTAISIYALGSLLLLNVTTTDSTKYATYTDDISSQQDLIHQILLVTQITSSHYQNICIYLYR